MNDLDAIVRTAYSDLRVAYRSGPNAGVEFEVTESVLEPAERYAEQQGAGVPEPVLG